MDLIDRAALGRGETSYTKLTYDELMFAIEDAPTIEAVPLDKLCEWLEKNVTMDCDGCRATIGSCEDDDVNEKVCNSRERWKIMLEKWMEGQHDNG